MPEQAAFRLDFPRWRAGFRPRARAVPDALAVGGRTGEVVGVPRHRVERRPHRAPVTAFRTHAPTARTSDFPAAARRATTPAGRG